MSFRRSALVAFLLLTLSVAVSGQAMTPGPSEALGPAAMGPSEALGPAAMGPTSPSDDCLTKVLNMSDCLSYVTVGSNVTVPDKPCCPELAGLVDSNPICLCDLLGKGSSYGLSIDLNRALKLPSICGVSTPPVDLCSVVGVPVGGPTASEGPTSGVQPPAGLAASPSTGNNGASCNAVSVLTILIGLAFGYLF
ncbi:Non-specific lipid-transfer protein-like protein [Melia azedarach]|uniref:Non-specific lipid-transfer protein-like protein n=1 Tax=Melia azedarach TaxID=155640 RepID=A0ACC1YN54_MELAZ|nr:Non-specific lipid-transfer protein-like protein [Melia azedarach]